MGRHYVNGGLIGTPTCRAEVMATDPPIVDRSAPKPRPWIGLGVTLFG
jgi:hypothetical protein